MVFLIRRASHRGHTNCTKHFPSVVFRFVGSCVSLGIMATDHILSLLLAERGKLTAAIEALQGPTTTEKTPGPGRKAVTPSVEQDSKPPEKVGPTAPAKRKMSAAGRLAIIAATKKRWAAVKAAKAAAVAPAPAASVPTATPKAVPPKPQVAAKHKASPAKNTAFRKKMSERMKAAWAARKKKAAAKGK
jgi:hypothetical protein